MNNNEELLRAPMEGYGEAIVLPEINVDHFEIKTNLLQLAQANLFHGYERENPHAHINSFKRITSILQFRDVPNDVIKLMMFPYSLEGAAKVWYEKEPPNSILTWEDLVTKFVNQVFPPSKTTHLKNEISLILTLPELTPTRMTLELADQSITHPKGLAEDVYVKVGKFHFPTDFVVVDFEADP
ncbi:reverse transcriptase domain-containing protein [Tanacetum coccineum]